MVVRHRHRSSAFTLSHEEEVGNPTNAENANDSPKGGGTLHRVFRGLFRRARLDTVAHAAPSRMCKWRSPAGSVQRV